MVLRQLIQEKEDHESMVLVLLSRSIKIGPKQTNAKRLLTPKRVEFAYGYGLNFIWSCANKVWGKGQNRPKSRDERLNEHVEQQYCEYGYESKSS